MDDLYSATQLVNHGMDCFLMLYVFTLWCNEEHCWVSHLCFRVGVAYISVTAGKSSMVDSVIKEVLPQLGKQVTWISLLKNPVCTDTQLICATMLMMSQNTRGNVCHYFYKQSTFFVAFFKTDILPTT